jgi:hypothetical protein
LVNKPKCPSRGHDQTKRIGTQEAWSFATLVLAETIGGKSRI